MTQADSKPTQTHVFRRHKSLVAETTSHIRRHYADVELIQTETFGDPLTHDVRLLGAGVKHQLLSPVVPQRHGGPPLHGGHTLPSGRDFTGNLDRCVECRLD